MDGYNIELELQLDLCLYENGDYGTLIIKAGNTALAASSTPTLCINTALQITHATTGQQE
jgi:hypothetical protein